MSSRTIATFSFWIVAGMLLGACSTTPEPGRMPTIVFSDNPVLEGEPVSIVIENLQPGATVQVNAQRAFSWGGGYLHGSSASFMVDPDGRIDLSRDAPLNGSWETADPTGLFWSMRQTEIKTPQGWSSETVEISVDSDGDGTTEASRRLQLLPSTIDLVETPLGEEFPGAFLLRPAGNEKLAAIIVLGGSEGGDMGARSIAPSLAARGYAVVGYPYYSPAWFGEEAAIAGLPQAFHNLAVDKMIGVREWLRDRPDIASDRIGLYGISKGAEFVLLAASRIEGFAAVAAIVPSDVVWEGWGPGTEPGLSSGFSWQGEPLPFVPYLDMDQAVGGASDGQRVAMRVPHARGRAAHPNRIGAARIRVEQIDEPVFVLGGGRDQIWDSAIMAINIAKTRSDAGLDTVTLVYPNAGHGLSQHPYAPSSPANAEARQQAWPALLSFFEKHLGRESQPFQLLLRDAYIVDIEGGRVKPKQAVAIRAGRIVAVMDDDRAGGLTADQTIDAHGAYLIPGMWDNHVHVGPDLQDVLNRKFPLWIAQGVTHVREMGSTLDQLAALRAHLKTSPDLPHPNMLAAGPLLDSKKQSWYGDLQFVLDSDQDVAQKLPALEKVGVDFLKAYSGLTPETYRAIHEFAEYAGLAVDGHIPAQIGIEAVAESAQRTIEHMEVFTFQSCVNDGVAWAQRALTARFQQGFDAFYQLEADFWRQIDWVRCAQAIKTFAERGGAWTPTLLMNAFSKDVIDETKLIYSPPGARSWCESQLADIDQADSLHRQGSMQGLQQAFDELVQAGVRILAGTDSPNHCNVAGFSQAWELGLLVDFGLSPQQALAAATTTPYAVYGLPDRARIAVGQTADFVALDSNPLIDISAVSDPVGVYTQGRWYGDAELKQLRSAALKFIVEAHD